MTGMIGYVSRENIDIQARSSPIKSGVMGGIVWNTVNYWHYRLYHPAICGWARGLLVGEWHTEFRSNYNKDIDSFIVISEISVRLSLEVHLGLSNKELRFLLIYINFLVWSVTNLFTILLIRVDNIDPRVVGIQSLAERKQIYEIDLRCLW